MSQTPDPYQDSETYDVVVLGGKTSPGVVVLSGHDRKINWNVAEGPGIAGGSTTLKSVPPVNFTATFYLVRDDAQGLNDFDQWDEFVKVIKSTVANGKPKALDIYHPDLAANDIKSVCQAEIGGKQWDGKGGCKIAVKFQEYRAPKPVGGAVKSQSNKNDPNADVKRELAATTLQYQATPWG